MHLFEKSQPKTQPINDQSSCTIIFCWLSDAPLDEAQPFCMLLFSWSFLVIRQHSQCQGWIIWRIQHSCAKCCIHSGGGEIVLHSNSCFIQKGNSSNPPPIPWTKKCLPQNQMRDSPRNNTTMLANFTWVNPLLNCTDQKSPPLNFNFSSLELHFCLSRVTATSLHLKPQCCCSERKSDTVNSQKSVNVLLLLPSSCFHAARTGRHPQKPHGTLGTFFPT